jgi:abequosyltransferase
MTLSVCIPTHNREECLRVALESVASQWRDDLELTVADNASTDGTRALVETFRQRLGAVRYFRWDENQGADRNYLKCVELATGEYCWILGSDDAVVDGAVDELQSLLSERRPTILLFNRLLCDKDLRSLREERFLDVGGEAGARFDFGVTGALERYLESARSMCATFSYLSSMAFAKSAWDHSPLDEDFIGTAYSHTSKLLCACARGAVLEYVNRPLVRCRLGNDSFRELGLARRVMLDLEGYALLAERCFGEERPASARALMKVLRHEYPFARILRYQGVLGSDPQWPEIVRLLRTSVGHASWKIGLARFFGRSRTIVNASFAWRDYWARRGSRPRGR